MPALHQNVAQAVGMVPCAIRLAALAVVADAAPPSALDRIGSTMRLGRSALICCDGDDADAYFRVVSGCVRISKTLSDGRRHVVDFIFPGGFFGFTQTDAYDCTAETIAPSVLKRYPRAQAELAAERDLGACNLLRRAVSAGLALAQARGMLLARLSAEERLAAFLLGIAGRAGAAERLPLPMTRADIGDYLGLTIETVSRTFTKFKQRGWIRLLDAHQVMLVDRRRLTELAEGGIALAA